MVMLSSFSLSCFRGTHWPDRNDIMKIFRSWICKYHMRPSVDRTYVLFVALVHWCIMHWCIGTLAYYCRHLHRRRYLELRSLRQLRS